MGYINAIKRNNDVLVWERKNGKKEVVTYPAPYYFYTKSKTGEFKSIYGDRLERHDYATVRQFNEARAMMSGQGKELFESDIPPELKLLSAKYYNKPAPVLNITFFDIEVDYDKERGYSTMEDPYAPINSIAMYHTWQNRMMVAAVVPDEYYHPWDTNYILEKMDEIAELPTDCEVEVTLFKTEHELLKWFLEEIEDSDVLSGWNSEGYDVPMIGKRLKLMGKVYFDQLSFSEGNAPRYREVETKFGKIQQVLDLSGRISADYMLIFKKYEVVERPSYKLEAIAEEVLADPKTKKPVMPKLEYTGSLADLYRKNFIWFIRYNLRDTEILKGFEDRLGYIEVANQMCHLSTGLFKHITGTVKLSDLATINYCHHELDGLIVNDIHVPDSIDKAKGAFVLLPQIGEHRWVGAIDINSLYPSTIRSNNISPETIMGQFVETEKAFEEIRKQSLVELTMETDNGLTLSASAEEWRGALLEKNWTISGYGTVFTQDYKGIMPTILENWYSTRKNYQKLMREAKDTGDKQKEIYYDKLQYVYKIKLNSYYGSLLNAYFRFYDKRLGESTTATSRAILLHQCSKVAELLDGKYAPTDRLEYDDKGKAHIGYSDKWSVVYGDSVAKDTNIILENSGEHTIESLFNYPQEKHNNGKEYYFPKNVKTLTYDEKTNKTTFEDIIYVMRHRTSKKMYRVWLTNSTHVDVTEDHSLIGYKKSKNGSCLVEVSPIECGEGVNTFIFLRNLGDIDISYVEYASIEEIEYDDYVYDIEVGNTHMFFANNILVHNTDSTYFNTHGKNKEESIAIADAVGEACSASFPEFMKETFLCSEGFNNIINTGREIVADGGIFIDKKRYILHIVDNEGYACDKMKIMGVETKKTTLPKPVAIKINGFVESYLKGGDWDEIAIKIVDYKEKLLNTKNIMSIGLPKGIQKVERYTREYAGDYYNKNKVKLPGHVAASIFYNICREKYGDKISPTITSGMKINVFYLSKMYGRFKSIAIPVDIETVPQWFFDEFEVKRDMHIERLLDNPINNIIKAIGKKAPSKQSLFTDNVLGF